MHIFNGMMLCGMTILLPAAEPAAATEPAPVAGAAPVVEAAPEPDPADIPAKQADLEDVMDELAELRAQVLRMEQSLDTWFGETLTELKAENEALRRELRQIYKDTGQTPPGVPMPGRELIEEVLKQPEENVEAETPLPAADPEVAQAVAEVGCFTLSEWGRTPEEAGKADPPRPSLKGLIGVVFPATPEADLQALGRRLRKEFDGYDNINIEIFDDRAAAEAFKSGRTVEPPRRVLSISRHKASGRDVILMIQGEQATEIPREETPSPTAEESPPQG